MAREQLKGERGVERDAGGRMTHITRPRTYDLAEKTPAKTRD